MTLETSRLSLSIQIGSLCFWLCSPPASLLELGLELSRLLLFPFFFDFSLLALPMAAVQAKSE